MGNELDFINSQLPSNGPYTTLNNNSTGTQIGQVNGNVNISIQISDEQLKRVLPNYFGGLQLDAPADTAQKVSHAAEWEALSHEKYCLFVVENEDFACNAFSIPKHQAIKKFTAVEDTEKYRYLSPGVIAELKDLPCIFAKRNVYYGHTEKDHPALLGRLSDVIDQGDNIKFVIDVYKGVSQDFLNQMIKQLGLAYSSLRTEFDEQHWSIKRKDLQKTLLDYGIAVD